MILNAGVMAPDWRVTADGYESQIGVNHFGHFLLAKLLMPKLREATQSHIGWASVVSVSSCMHHVAFPAEGVKLDLQSHRKEARFDRRFAYGQSKLANLLFAKELQKRLETSQSFADHLIFVNALHPGAVNTKLHFSVEGFLADSLGLGFANATRLWFKRQVAFFYGEKLCWQVRTSAGRLLVHGQLSTVMPRVTPTALLRLTSSSPAAARRRAHAALPGRLREGAGAGHPRPLLRAAGEGRRRQSEPARAQ